MIAFRANFKVSHSNAKCHLFSIEQVKHLNDPPSQASRYDFIFDRKRQSTLTWHTGSIHKMIAPFEKSRLTFPLKKCVPNSLQLLSLSPFYPSVAQM